ncbi:MAG: tetratricopeptide repeat protein [Burkholderiales bacterium]|nr:tetratricopeptide repeat protein [Burkholderiales bacterium]
MPGGPFVRHHQPRLLACVAALALAFTPAGAWAAAGAEIVLLTGNGERRQSDASAWVAAAVKDQVNAGGSVRTLANSQMGLLMADRSQIRLNQNSSLQIKSVAEASQWSESTVRLNSGRAWSQARPQTAPAPTEARGIPVSRVKMETPTATIGIRGTDWEVEVEPDGRTRVVVLSGEVDLANDFGSVTLAQGEAGLAEAGKAPVRFVLVNPQSRVQWVSAWRAQPQRWGASAAARRGDELLALGETAQAQQVLAPAAQGGRGDPLASALLAHALARQDKLDEAQALLATALATHARHLEVQLAIGDIAMLQGDTPRARAAYLGVLQAQAGQVDALYGLGVIASEHERVADARALLGEALAKSPQDARVQAELAAAEAFAGNLAESERLLADVLAREPSNYQALTALGVTRLKSGRTQAALDDFLKAGLIEPRYARAWLYSGVAFYRLGERDRAMQAFAKASQLDARDPMPYVFRSMVLVDALDPGAAIEASREAQLRMPYLRSLNQVASNQKGSANLGSSLAAFGLEEWAGYYAARAYTPYWGASHLFLADRYTGKFNRNSELFQGYITDPTAFGASNRESTLVTGPGHYGRVDVLAERTDWTQGAVVGTLNGLAVEAVPIAYYASGDFAQAEARRDGSSGRLRNFTGGLGVKPNERLGVFAFVTDTRRPGESRSAALPMGALEHEDRRADVGLNFKVQPDNQVWLKAGSGRQRDQVTGVLWAPEAAASLNRIFLTNIFTPTGSLDDFHLDIDQRDVQLRHTFTAGAVQWTWGAEQSRQAQRGALVTTFAPARIDSTIETSARATDAYLSARFKPTQSVEAQVDLFAQQVRVRRQDVTSLVLLFTPPDVTPIENGLAERRFNELNPRLGLQWNLAPLQTLRAALQRWRKPASAGTLAPVDTVGIPANDRLLAEGGLYRRVRVQWDGELDAHTFVRAFADHERIDNGLTGRRSPISDFQLTQLERLRSRPDVFEAKPDLEDTPQFEQGRVGSFGVAFNRLMNRRHAVAVRYLYRDAQQSGAATRLAIPYVPRHFLQAGSQWSAGGQWLLGAGATWRSERFRDDANLQPLAAGWQFGFTAYWESLDRRHSMQALLGNLLPRRDAGHDRDPKLVVRYALRL